jgi:uncharacterized protein
MPAFDISPKPAAGRQLIQSYGDGGFRIAGAAHRGSVLVFPERTMPWAVKTAAGITVASLADVVAEAEHVAFLLIGCGASLVPPPAVLRQHLKGAGLILEWMDTGAACRTFNVLLLEDRRVAAALIAVP